jgi:hypothetical protein
MLGSKFTQFHSFINVSMSKLWNNVNQTQIHFLTKDLGGGEVEGFCLHVYTYGFSSVILGVRQLDFAEDDSTGRSDMRIFVDVDTALIP